MITRLGLRQHRPGGGYIGQQSGSIGIGFAIPAGTAIIIANQWLAR